MAVCHSDLEVECILVVESALGHELTSERNYETSALHPKADVSLAQIDASDVPIADIVRSDSCQGQTLG